MSGASFGLVDVVDRVTGELTKRIQNRRYLHDPVLWAREYLGVQLWYKQREIAESVRDFHNTACAAGHGVGKTFLAGIVAAWWVDVHPPEETFIASTAPSIDQVSLLWDNIRRVHGIAQKRYDQRLVDHPLPGYITGDNKWKLPDGTLLGQGRKPPDDKADVSFQGRHATYLFAIGDEAVGLSSGFLEALGNIATADTNRVLLLANPTDPSSAMAKLWDPKITHWNRIHISVFQSPAVEPDPNFDISLAPALSGWGYINDRKAEWGEDDPRYISRVKGEWAFDAGNTVFTADELAQAKRCVVRPYSDTTPEFGWDIARMGADSTVGYTLEVGEVWTTDPETGKALKPTGQEGFRIRQYQKWSKAPLVGTDPENLGSATRIHNLALGEGAEIVKIDASGIGSAVIDGLAELGAMDSYTVVEVFGGAPSSDKRAYRNMRAEQFFLMKADMHKGILDLDPDDTDLFDELEGIQYENVDNGAIKIESKDAIRKDGRKSPDHADACWYAYLDVTTLLDPLAAAKPGTKIPIDYADLDEQFNSYYYGQPGTPL